MFRSTLLNGLSVVFTLGLNFFLLPFMIHRLGPAAYGIWVLVLSFSLSGGYFSLSDLGLQLSIVKAVAEADAQGEARRISEVVSGALLLLSATAAVAVSVLFVIGLVATRLFSIPPDFHVALRLLFWLLAGELGAGLPGLAFAGVLEGLQRYGTLRIIDVIRQVAYGLIVVGALLTGHGVVAMGVALALSSAVGTLSWYVAARRVQPDLRISPRLVHVSTLRSLFSFGGWVFLAKVNSALWSGMDPIILAAIVSSSVLAGYDVASKIQAAVAVAISFTSSALFPMTAGLHAGGDTTKLRELLVRGTRYSLALALPLVVGAGIMARPLIVHWVGPRFGYVAGPAQLFLSLQLISASASVANTMLVGLGRVKLVTGIASLAVVINLAVSIGLAGRLGISGVILGTFIGYGVTGPWFIWLALRQLKMGLWEFARHAILPMLPWACIFAICVELTERELFAPTNLVSTVAVCVPAFAVYALGVGFVVMGGDERRMLLGFVLPGSARRRMTSA